MPFYDYKCNTCNHEELDVKRPMSENVSIYVCPKCQSNMIQIIRPFRFELRGKGWFKDLYSSKKKENATQKEG